MAINSKEDMISFNVKRLVELEPIVHSYISDIDLSCSNVYDRNDSRELIVQLTNVLGQMDSDLSALLELLQED